PRAEHPPVLRPLSGGAPARPLVGCRDPRCARAPPEPRRRHRHVGPAGVSTTTRPAFYALAPGGWRDYVTLLHPPYTAWHLSYVVIGACLAPHLYTGRLVATAAAFFLALGISAHALDELQGRPLATRIPEGVLVALSIVPLAAAVTIGIAGAIAFNLWLLAFVGVGLALVPVYNLELFGGALHNQAG